MDDSTQFTHVPKIGYPNIPLVLDGDTGLQRKLLFNSPLGTASGLPEWITKNTKGDEGNQFAGGSVSSYTSKDPSGRLLGGAGRMITTFELIGEGTTVESCSFLSFHAIPPGLQGLLPPNYSLSKQPPAESFDYSKWLPRVIVMGCLSFYGGGIASSSSGGGSSPFGNTGRFPTTPSMPPMLPPDVAGPVLYIPKGFYGNLGTILDDLFGAPAGTFNLSLVDPPEYGLLAIYAELDSPIGTACAEVDFSWSGAN